MVAICSTIEFIRTSLTSNSTELKDWKGWSLVITQSNLLPWKKRKTRLSKWSKENGWWGVGWSTQMKSITIVNICPQVNTFKFSTMKVIAPPTGGTHPLMTNNHIHLSLMLVKTRKPSTLRRTTTYLPLAHVHPSVADRGAVLGPGVRPIHVPPDRRDTVAPPPH